MAGGCQAGVLALDFAACVAEEPASEAGGEEMAGEGELILEMLMGGLAKISADDAPRDPNEP